jgi:uncharacterized membrane protein
LDQSKGTRSRTISILLVALLLTIIAITAYTLTHTPNAMGSIKIVANSDSKNKTVITFTGGDGIGNFNLTNNDTFYKTKSFNNLTAGRYTITETYPPTGASKRSSSPGTPTAEAQSEPPQSQSTSTPERRSQSPSTTQRSHSPEISQS